MKSTEKPAHPAEASTVPAHGAPVRLTREKAEIYEICEMGYPVLKKRDASTTNEMINQMREELGI